MDEDISLSLILDGNAIAGMLQELFGGEMTIAPTECAHCGKISAIGEMVVFMNAPGIVVRCPTCEGVVVRIVRTPSGTYIDLHGVASVRMVNG